MTKKSIIDNIIKKFEDYKVDGNIVNYIAQNYNSIIYMTFDKFCYVTNCTYEDMESFLEESDIKNFDQLKDLIHNVVKMYEFIDLNDVQSCKDKIQETVNEIINIELSNIFDFKKNLDFELVIHLINDIFNSKDVVFVGTRASTPLVTYASYIFNKIGIRATKIDSADTSFFDIIPNLDRSTLIIAFGFSRYPKGTIRLLNFLKKRGFKIVSITDYTKSPLVNFSEYSLLVKSNSYNYTDSYIEAMLLLNTLIIVMGKLDNERLIKRLKEYDETAQNLGYFL